MPRIPFIEDDENLRNDIRRHDLPGGWVVLAGRTDEANERLSLRLARANDWWFHVRGMPGSHVLLRARDDDEPPRETLKQAAAVAAYYSRARTGGLTPVSCTRARYVTRARGSRRGTVHIRKEIVLKVRPALPSLEKSAPGE